MTPRVSLQQATAYDNLNYTDVFNSGMKTSHGVIIGRTKYQSFKKVCMLTAVISIMQKILSAELVLCCSTLDLFVLQTFIKTMPREAKKRKS